MHSPPPKCIPFRMTKTISITHHQRKPEYTWEFVVPEGPTVLLAGDKLSSALSTLGLGGKPELEQQIQALPNGGSQSVNADVNDGEIEHLVQMGVKTV